jgi:hypothetical protein
MKLIFSDNGDYWKGCKIERSWLWVMRQLLFIPNLPWKKGKFNYLLPYKYNLPAF